MTASSDHRPVARAFAPGNVSGIFKVIADPDPAKAHSLGWGFTVSDGVEVAVSQLDSGASVVDFNGERIEFPTVVDATRRLTDEPLSVDIRTKLPLSSGFGLSGASAFAACMATDALLGSGKSKFELASIAHVAEVENLTGLGDVCAQHIGGCLVKVAQGNPLDAVRIPLAPQPVYWRYFGAISTKEVLADDSSHSRINAAADAALETIAKLMQGDQSGLLNQLMDVALGFATSSGLLQDNRVKSGIAQARAAGGAATMIMLGNAVVSTVPFDGSTEARLDTVAGKLIA